MTGTLPYPYASTLQQWSVDELAVLGAPNTPSNVSAVMAWGNTEGGWFNNPDTYNPLNTTRNTNSAGQPLGGVPTNSVGVLAYPSLQAGLQGTAATINQVNMAGVKASLMGGNGANTLQNGINSSAWGGYGQTQDQIQSIIDSGYIANPSIANGYANPSVASSLGSNAELTSYTPTTSGPSGKPTTIASIPHLGGVTIPSGLPTKIILGTVGIIILLMGLHQLFSNNGAVNTVIAPIGAAKNRAKSALP